MAKSKKERSVFRIMITPAAKEGMNAIVDQIGITHIALSSRIITWLADQPDDVKAGVLGMYPELVGDPTVTFLRNMAKPLAKR